VNGGPRRGYPRVSAGGCGAVVLLLVYLLTLAPDVTFWDAGEFIAAAHSLGIPHPPGTPLYILLLSAWTKLVPLPFAFATNVFSAAATATAAGLAGRLVHRATGNAAAALAATVASGGMSSIWLNATETEVYAVALLLGVLMIVAGERAGREVADQRWLYLTGYLIALAVPLHLSALVAAPAAIALASQTPAGIAWRRALALGGVLVVAIGVGRMSLWVTIAGALMILLSPLPRVRFTYPVSALAVAFLATSALAFMYVRARFDPAINQGDSSTWTGLADMVARRQYAVHPLWPRMAPAWVQFGNFGQYADWQAALSLGPTVMPSVLRTLFTMVFLTLGYQGALAHWTIDRRTWIGVAALFLGGSLGVIVYLNLPAGPSIGYGILPANVMREARERDYFFVFAFLAWGIWAGIGSVIVAQRLARPAWVGAVVAFLPIVLNWRAVTRRVEPEQSMPMVFATAMLESTPADGVLFVMGDNDSYPLWYAQEVRRVRPDVAVVTVPLLPTDWYRAQIASRHDLLDRAERNVYDGTLETAARIARGARAAGRPVAASVMMTARERAKLGSRWRAAGLIYTEGDGIDTTTANRIATFAAQRVSAREVRPAIDPINAYFRRLLDCPRSVADIARGADSTRLDSACNYR
jgi:hypothetical protein